jgi:iron complex outermembrane receptor protein
MRALAGCLALVSFASFAQEQGDVVVTATRVDQPSLGIPASIDRVYAEEIREGRPQVNLSESMGRVPGIRLVSDGIPASMPDGQGQGTSSDEVDTSG